MRNFLIAWVILLALAPSPPAKAAANREPLKIKSNTMHADNESKTATFVGKVVARQGDMTLYTDRLVITYSGSGEELSRVEAFGNVRIQQGLRQAKGAHATYDPKLARIYLDGSPMVMQGDDVITGRLITYFVNEQASVVESGPNQRVEAVIHPGGKNARAKP
jgi:lipopolysaccharide export system protein LptA